MDILSKPMGDYQTNCYIVSLNAGDIVIDPGFGATSWVEKHIQKPLAILNTHGHFDHVWSNDELQKSLKVPLYCPCGDAFMLQNDIFGLGVPSSKADVEVRPDAELDISSIKVKFWHFPGHTPGCSAIEIENVLFSGDFLFKHSIGRTDFPYSSGEDMKKSLQKVLGFKKDMRVLPGHGEETSLFAEKESIAYFIRYIPF